MMYNLQQVKLFLTSIFIIFHSTSFAQIILETPRVESVLYLGSGKNQPLIVGLGGSEGGNAWSSNYWEKTREKFIEQGYAFLAIGYFGAEGTPEKLEKIAIEDVYHAITVAAKNKLVNNNKIAVIGGSRGADLTLLLGSYYKDISCIVSIVGSHVVFPSNTAHFSTSSWTYQNKELPFVPVNKASMPFLMKRDLRGAFETMLQDTIAAKNSIIKVENINGPILFLSATKDEICPSTPMAEKMITRLRTTDFKHYFNHIAVEGSHAEPLKHFDIIFQFLATHFPL